MKEPKISDGERSIQPLTTAILLPACWVFLVSGSGRETSLPRMDIIIPEKVRSFFLSLHQVCVSVM